MCFTDKDEIFRETVIVLDLPFSGRFYFLRGQSRIQGDIHDVTRCSIGKIKNLFNIIVCMALFCYSRFRTIHVS